MKTIKKYTAIQLQTEIVNDNVNINLTFGEILYPCYNKIYPTEEFDTEEEALEYACKTNKYSKWIIVPVIRFDY